MRSEGTSLEVRVLKTDRKHVSRRAEVRGSGHEQRRWERESAVRLQSGQIGGSMRASSGLGKDSLCLKERV
jgi:hypothetical protein